MYSLSSIAIQSDQIKKVIMPSETVHTQTNWRKLGSSIGQDQVYSSTDLYYSLNNVHSRDKCPLATLLKSEQIRICPLPVSHSNCGCPIHVSLSSLILLPRFLVYLISFALPLFNQVWLTLFPEGTRFDPTKTSVLTKSTAFAKDHGLPELHHVWWLFVALFLGYICCYRNCFSPIPNSV